jgi:hypothetical protein
MSFKIFNDPISLSAKNTIDIATSNESNTLLANSKLPLVGGEMEGSIDMKAFDIKGINTITSNNESITIQDSIGTQYMKLGADNNYSSLDMVMHDDGKYIGGLGDSKNLTLSSTLHINKGTIICEDVLDMNGNIITNISNPLSAYDAVNLQYLNAEIIAAGAGDVVGPSIAVDSQLASFNSTTGKLIKDSGIDQADVFLRTGTVEVTGSINMGDQTLHGSSADAGNLTLSSTDQKVKGNILTLDEIGAIDGTAAFPSYAFASDYNSGMSNDGGGVVLSSGGSTVATFDSKVTLSTNLDMNGLNVNNVSTVNVDDGVNIGLGETTAALSYFGTTNNFLQIPDNRTNALIIRHSTNELINLNTNTGSESILFKKDLDMFSNNVIGVNDVKVNGIIDSTDAGTLAIAPANATKLELGDSGVTTEVKGDLSLSGGDLSLSGGDILSTGGNIVSTSDNATIGYVEPLRSLFAVAASITVSDRSFIKASNGSYANAIGSIVINCGSTTQNYRLVTRVNSSGSIWRVGLSNNTNPNSSFGVANFAVFGSSGGGSNGGGIASGSGGTEEVDITTQAIANADYIEYILDRTCQDFYVYYHGAELTDTPTLLYKIVGMTMASARWFIGDASLIVSAFDIDTIESTGLVVADDVKIGGTLTVGGSLISAPSSISATTAWEIAGIPIVTPPADTVLKIAKSGNVVNIGFDDFEGKTPAAGQFESVYVLPVAYRPSDAVKCAVIHLNANVPNIGYVEILPTGVLRLGSQASGGGWAINTTIAFSSPSITYNIV